MFREVLNGLLGSVSGNNGSGMSALAELYMGIYRAFGLKPSHLLRQGEQVPLWVRSDAFNRTTAFEVQGSALNIPDFLADSHRGVFRDIQSHTILPVGYVWAYDLREINTGKMSGWAVPSHSDTHLQSEEMLHILGIIGETPLPPLTAVPAVNLRFGSMWERYALPDEITITLHSYFFSTDPFDDLRARILNSYIQRGNVNGVQAMFRVDLQEDTLYIVFDEPRPYGDEADPLATVMQQEEAPVVSDDGFPYDFYRGLGLIDEENKVVVETLLGPMRVDMREPEARAALLNHQPAQPNKKTDEKEEGEQ